MLFTINVLFVRMDTDHNISLFKLAKHSSYS